MPALLTSTSTPPKRSCAAATSGPAKSVVDRSQTWTAAPSPEPRDEGVQALRVAVDGDDAATLLDQAGRDAVPEAALGGAGDDRDLARESEVHGWGPEPAG